MAARFFQGRFSRLPDGRGILETDADCIFYTLAKIVKGISFLRSGVLPAACTGLGGLAAQSTSTSSGTRTVA